MTNEFGRYLRNIRKSRGRKLKDVALAVGKTTSYICDLELGRRGTSRIDPLMIFKMADYLNVPVNEFLVRAGIVDRETHNTYADYTKILRSKLRAQHVGALITAAKNDIKALKNAAEGVRNGVPEILYSLENHILELDSTLKHG
jgi:transcriptional regulator with XRE-family HTH domain